MTSDDAPAGTGPASSDEIQPSGQAEATGGAAAPDGKAAADEQPSKNVSPVSPELCAAIDEELDGLDDGKGAHHKRRGGSVLISIVCIALALFIVFSFRGEIAFWMTAPGVPAAIEAADLSASGNLERLVGSHVSARGTPGKSYARFKRHFSMHELVALSGTPLLVQRAPTGAAESQPADRRPTEASGRLVREDMLPGEYKAAFEVFLRRNETILQNGHLYVLMQEEAPRRGLLVPLVLLAAVFMLVSNVFHLIRALRNGRRDGTDTDADGDEGEPGSGGDAAQRSP